jgi:tether containing UBX domain for GLUT4
VQWQCITNTLNLFAVELPDSFFELTPAELKAVLAAQESRRIAEENAGFKTRAMREAEMNKRAQKYPKTMLRIRFPDRVQLQLQFLSQETVGDVYQAIKDYLRTPDRPFRLYVAPPRRDLTDKHVRLFDACLAPASVVHFVWANTGKSNSPRMIC